LLLHDLFGFGETLLGVFEISAQFLERHVTE